ncbi:MAG: 2-amino-4-hydroxy-6-hydroxymethyldihydropteridine diphosphokinase [Planctomycetota bacterium]|jgi:2-amino-4-hydroxy-6-hydroxymethyldihydropteridine diphosphokinase
MAKLTTAYIGLGSNLQDREGSIRNALKILAEVSEVEVTNVSELIETTPLGGTNQPNYLNAVAEVKTTLSAKDLHKTLANIETSLGRTREEKWSPRIIDLDLLLFGAEVINSPDLTVPHPQMHLRSFVLQSLCQLNGELLHPVIKESINELAARLSGGDFMLNPDLPQLVSVAGIIGVGKTTLTKKLSNVLGREPLLEAYDTNPFMPDVYAGRKDLALDSQLYFLTHRAEQLNHNKLAAGQIAVSDYIFDKEIIYARRLLNAQQLALYQNFYPAFSAEIAAPVLVIYLTDSVQKCLERIHKRNRPYEQKIEPQFMETLNSDYERLFANWKTCPVIRIQISKLSYTKDTNIDHLVNQIKSYIAE